ncbi:MAG: hypothetical protein HQ514_12055 [Rhodospirillales bacterium]|nr:hypothetical protein [Rhodospirillales bacterium]
MSRQNNPGAPKQKQQNSVDGKRQERQADALRENLKRRKEQQRARAPEADVKPTAEPTAEPDANEDTYNG